MKIGIDVGGTFTDFLLTLDDGTSEIYKVLSTPEDPSIGVMNGLNEMAENKGLPMNEFIKKVEQNGGNVLMPKMSIPGIGYHTYCKDTEGNIFGIMESDQSAK